MVLAIDGSATGEASGAGSVTCTLTTTKAGDVIILLVDVNSQANYPTITDGSNLNWIVRARVMNGTNGHTVTEFVAVAASALTNDIIRASVGTSGNLAMVAFGVSGVSNPATPFDPNAGAPGTGYGGSGQSLSAAISTTQASALIIGLFQAGGTQTFGAGSNFTPIAQSSGPPTVFAEYQLVGSPQTGLSVPASDSSSNTWTAIADAIVASGGVPPMQAAVVASASGATGLASGMSITVQAAAGQSIYVFMFCPIPVGNLTLPPTCTDSVAGALSEDTGAVLSPAYPNIGIFHLDNASAGPHTITASWGSGATCSAGLAVLVIGGVSSPSTIQTGNLGSGFGVGSTQSSVYGVPWSGWTGLVLIGICWCNAGSTVPGLQASSGGTFAGLASGNNIQGGLGNGFVCGILWGLTSGPNIYATIQNSDGGQGGSNQAVAVLTGPNGPIPISAAASAVPTSGPAPLTAAFTAAATGGRLPIGYAWQFGDGGTSVQQDPSHTYSAPGAYTANMQATDALGDEAGASVGMSVGQAGGGSGGGSVPTGTNPMVAQQCVAFYPATPAAPAPTPQGIPPGSPLAKYPAVYYDRCYQVWVNAQGQVVPNP
jgi:hypothetical protein